QGSQHLLNGLRKLGCASLSVHIHPHVCGTFLQSHARLSQIQPGHHATNHQVGCMWSSYVDLKLIQKYLKYVRVRGNNKERPTSPQGQVQTHQAKPNGKQSVVVQLE